MSGPFDPAVYRDASGQRRTMEVYVDLWDVREALDQQVRVLLERHLWPPRPVIYKRLESLVHEFDRLASAKREDESP